MLERQCLCRNCKRNFLSIHSLDKELLRRPGRNDHLIKHAGIVDHLTNHCRSMPGKWNKAQRHYLYTKHLYILNLYKTGGGGGRPIYVGEEVSLYKLQKELFINSFPRRRTSPPPREERQPHHQARRVRRRTALFRRPP